MSDQVTRRRYLGLVGGALAVGAAGCQTTSTPDGETTTGGDAGGTTPRTTWEERAVNDPADPAQQTSLSDEVSVYTQVYRDTIDSVVTIRVTTASGGGQGSGWVYDGNYVVTNEHVVEGAEEIEVRFNRGEWRSATVVGDDPYSDLGVIEVSNPPSYAEALPLAEAVPPIGERVVALGTPFGLEQSLSAGIVSGTNRSIPAQTSQTGFSIPAMVQTDAAVNSGNSGGPLVDLDGRVVGVVSAGGGDNIAFAISSPLVARVVPALIEDGEYEHAYMGVGLREVSPGLAESLGLDDTRGIYVSQVVADGPADGTLQQGDVIVSLDDESIRSLQELSSYLALQKRPGDEMQITVIRDGDRQTLAMTLGDRPDPD